MGDVLRGVTNTRVTFNDTAVEVVPVVDQSLSCGLQRVSGMKYFRCEMKPAPQEAKTPKVHEITLYHPQYMT